jgi:small subunit ribosomal protein S6
MAQNPAYDLFVLIDAEVPEDGRGRIVDAVKGQIDSGDGDLKGHSDWGVRKLAYEINHRGEAHYHLFQLEASRDLIAALEHALAIDDAVLRHRFIRLPGAAPAEPPRAPAPYRPMTAGEGRPRDGERRSRDGEGRNGGSRDGGSRDGGESRPRDGGEGRPREADQASETPSG